MVGHGKFYPAVEVRYSVGGQTYTTSLVSLDGIAMSHADALDVCNTYPTNSQVVVYYNPKKPSFAVLVPGTQGGAIVAAAVAIFFLASWAWYIVRK
jgi:hypothetical protein